MVDGGIAALQTHSSSNYLLLFDSFLCFVLSPLTFVGRSIFLFFPAAVTHSVGGVEDKEGWRERLRESKKKKKGGGG